MPRGTDGAQQCTTAGTLAAASTVRRPDSASAGSTARTRFSPLALGTAPASTAGSDGSSSWSSSRAPGTRAAHLGQVPGHPLGQRRGQVADRARGRPAPAPGCGSARPWRPASTARRHSPSERPGIALGRHFQRVEIAGQQRLRAAQITARPVGQPPAPGRRLGGQVDQHGRGTAGQPGAGPAAGQLGQVTAGRAARRRPAAWSRAGRFPASTQPRSHSARATDNRRRN